MECRTVTEATDIKVRLAWRVVEQCCEWWQIAPDVDVKLSQFFEMNCCGWCYERKPGVYVICIARDQSIRDFIATVVHEMVHVRQYMTRKWRGDGEREAARLQYRLADFMWRNGVL